MFIYRKITSIDAQQWAFLSATLDTLDKYLYLYIALLLVFAFSNYALESLKWKLLTRHIKILSFWSSLEQVVASHTAAMITPARLGEFGVRALYFAPRHSTEIMGLTLVGNIAQLLSTLIFGIVGAAVIVHSYYEQYLLYFYFFLGCICIGFGVWYYFKASSHFNLRNVQVLGYALGRYAIFSHMTFFLLVGLGMNLPYVLSMACISMMYMGSSFIPSLQVFDAVIKGSIAIFVFGLFGDFTLIVLCAATIGWIFNAMLPAMVGSYFILRFDTAQIFSRKLLNDK